MATPLETTDYQVLVTDQFGCQNTETVRVTVEDDFKIVASNVFTPDDNGQNDTWRGRPGCAASGGDRQCGNLR